MSEQFANHQIFSNSISDVAQVVKGLIRTRAFVSPVKDNWITIYDQMADYEMDYEEISYLSREMSSSLATVVFAFIVRSGLHFMYLVYDCGQKIDEFCDDPESFGVERINNKALKGSYNQSELLLKYCLPDIDINSVHQVLDSSRSGDVEKMGQEAAYQLALLLGIDGYRTINGYSYFEDNSLYNTVDPVLEDAKDFLLIYR